MQVRVLLIAAFLMLNGCANAVQLGELTSSDFQSWQVLRADPYPKLSLDIVQTDNYAPAPSDVDHLLDIAKKYARKPGGVVVTFKTIHDQGTREWTMADLIVLRTLHTTPSWGDTAHIPFVFVPGNYKTNHDTNAISLTDESSFFFWDRYSSFAQPGVILIHEFGHLMGLVNAGTKPTSPHENTNSRTHCSNVTCPMWPSPYVFQSNDYDDPCQQDLGAFK